MKKKISAKPKTQKQPQMKKPQMKKIEFKFKFNLKRLLIWFLILMLFLPGIMSLWEGMTGVENVSLSQLMADIKEERVEEIEVVGNKLMVDYKDSNETKVVVKESDESLTATLKASEIDPSSVNIVVADQSGGQAWFELLSIILPVLIVGGIFFMMLRQARGQQDGIMGFGKSKAKLFSKGKQDVKFSDVGGMEEVKKELEEVVDFLKNPKKYTKLGARTPKGVLLVGPSGTGKTLLARAVAGEAETPFFSMAGSEFMEMLVGVGASRARDLFETAKKSSPAIIFIDEIDAIGRVRGMGSMGGHDEREQTLNQILVEMDGFTATDNVIVLAATNRGDLLDPALTRPGRFDRRVTLSLPDINERKRILKIHSKGKPLSKEVKLEKMAKRTVGFSGADLENALNEAAIQAARENKKSIEWDHVEEAATKVKMGPQKRRLQSEYEKKMTAYHEAGHALLSHFLPHADPVHRISIVSRGFALGYTETPPEEDKYQQTKSELIERIAVLLGGRTAEKQIFNELTGGAASDIDRATRIARAMVVDYGMDEDLGPINYGPMYDTTDYGKVIMEPSKMSDEVQSKVDGAIRKFVGEAQKLAESILLKRRKELDKVSKALIEKETLDGAEFEKIVGSKKVRVDEGKK
jgi:cell division protease FtsH